MDGITEWTFEGRPEPELLSTKYGLTASATVTRDVYKRQDEENCRADEIKE